MTFDLRIPIGLMFTIYGLMLSGYGLLGDTEVLTKRSEDINIDLYWGGFLLVFGLAMLLTGWSAMKKAPAPPK